MKCTLASKKFVNTNMVCDLQFLSVVSHQNCNYKKAQSIHFSNICAFDFFLMNLHDYNFLATLNSKLVTNSDIYV